ncbi:MAG TPA: hypothetical protein PL037_09860, partial [Elusimicrobiales bacterium]|nr:hypothetical protein [Elusimicrobiales bacterium]
MLKMKNRTLKGKTAAFAVSALCTLLTASCAAAAQVTLTGLDVLERDGFDVLKGKKVGVITNHSSV